MERLEDAWAVWKSSITKRFAICFRCSAIMRSALYALKSVPAPDGIHASFSATYEQRKAEEYACYCFEWLGSDLFHAVRLSLP